MNALSPRSQSPGQTGIGVSIEDENFLWDLLRNMTFRDGTMKQVRERFEKEGLGEQFDILYQAIVQPRLPLINSAGAPMRVSSRVPSTPTSHFQSWLPALGTALTASFLWLTPLAAMAFGTISPYLPDPRLIPSLNRLLGRAARLRNPANRVLAAA